VARAELPERETPLPVHPAPAAVEALVPAALAEVLGLGPLAVAQAPAAPAEVPVLAALAEVPAAAVEAVEANNSYRNQSR
jgi:hypothetical protein